ncbi:DUF2953 domain-containing protein [Paenibacillus sp. BR2-3]|uniref:DUF2953 domain-containing protein n=1 Tax=Paenibacillus sp. BR2-3 TaxID=3048494 RepID=UPI003977DFB5
MTLWLALPLALLILAIVLLLSSSIDFHLRLWKRGKDDHVEINISFLFGVVKLHYELPAIVFQGFRRGVRVKLEESGVAPVMEKKQNDDEKYIDKETVEKWFDKFKKALKATEGLKKWGIDTMSHVKITKLDWSTDFSLGDAAGTATAAGALWGLKWSMVGWFSQWVKLKKSPRLFVVPVFEDDLAFTTEMACAGSISIIHAIYSGLRLFIRAVKADRELILWKEIIRGRV